MRAARYYGKEDIRIEELLEPQVGPGQVKVEPAFVGICGTDLHEYLGGPNFAPVKPHPITKETIPITLGHEFSGVIQELGPGVSGLHVGQKVAVQPTLACSQCAPCHLGVENACSKGGFVGLSGGGGGLSDAVVVSGEFVHVLPENIPLDIGALVEPLSVAWHAISAARMDAQSTVLILGGGPIGLAILQCLQARGVSKIVVSEVAAQRQAFAREFGAMRVLDPRSEDAIATCQQLSDGKGADVVFDAAGVPASLSTACQAVRAGGSVVNVAIWEKEVPIQPNWLVFREASYTGVLGYRRQDFEAVIAHLASGQLRPHGMITRKIGLEEVVEHGVKALINEKDKHVKILVEMARGRPL